MDWKAECNGGNIGLREGGSSRPLTRRSRVLLFGLDLIAAPWGDCGVFPTSVVWEASLRRVGSRALQLRDD